MVCPAKVYEEHINVGNEADIAMAVYIFFWVLHSWITRRQPHHVSKRSWQISWILIGFSLATWVSCSF